MPLRHIDEADLDYFLLLFDRDGNERREQDGSLLRMKLNEIIRESITDVFISSHGWKGDIPAAISQYASWIATMAAQASDRDRARALDPAFKPFIVGVHWPSLPWGNENREALLGDNDKDEFAAEQQMNSDELLKLYAKRIADTDAARAALRTILAADDLGGENGRPNRELPLELEAAYQILFEEAGLRLDGAAAAPGSDQQTFRPSLTISQWTSAAESQAEPGLDGEPGLLSGTFRQTMRNKLLMPLRQLSFWSMKRRARNVGETGVHSLLVELQESAPEARFHLMGHSFGCIVVSAAVSGPLAGSTVASRLPRPVDSLFLVQGALSLWSFAERIPYTPNVPGYFRPMEIAPSLVRGPIVTTRSSFDRAVGTYFPLAAQLGNDRLLGEELPEFGGVGTFGIQGTAADMTHDLLVLNADDDYGFVAGQIYNVDASRVIRRGGGPSGAHSDIAHPEIAHLFWQAALAGIANS